MTIRDEDGTTVEVVGTDLSAVVLTNCLGRDGVMLPETVEDVHGNDVPAPYAFVKWMNWSLTAPKFDNEYEN